MSGPDAPSPAGGADESGAGQAGRPTKPSPTQPGPNKPGRHDRSFGGLAFAMLVTLLLVGAYVGFRALTRDQPDRPPDKVDYLDSVRALQEADVSVVYPRDLPTGWTPTSTTYTQGRTPTWGIGMVTDQGDFVGLQQQTTDVDRLLGTYLNGDPRPDPDATVESALGNTWRTWSTASGDHAFAMEPSAGALSGQVVLVYGSAPVADQEELIQLLTTDALPKRRSPASAGAS